MKTIDLLRHRIIMNFMAQPSEKGADTAINLCQQMAAIHNSA